jgi:DNA polymerase kappa
MTRSVSNRLTLVLQFFENAANSSSPRKKRKLSDDQEQDDDHPMLSQDGYEDAMPGYYEHEELGDSIVDEVEEHIEGDSPEHGKAGPGGTHSRPPVSAPAASSNQQMYAPTTSNSRATSHPPQALEKSESSRSSSKPPTLSSQKRKTSLSPTDDDVQMHTCPICSKALQTDNRGLNEHVDFCLSKNAIREAQVMSQSGSSKSLKQPLPVPVWGKPGVKMKKRKSG